MNKRSNLYVHWDKDIKPCILEYSLNWASSLLRKYAHQRVRKPNEIRLGERILKPDIASVNKMSLRSSSLPIRFQIFFLSLLGIERRLAEMADNARERALNQMMKGKLEANPEDELKKDLEKPEFMSKVVEEWSEEEHKLAKEFEKKEQELKEQREKFKKSLETELKKHQSSIHDTTAAFDERLNQLFQRKIKTEMVIFQVKLILWYIFFY